MISLYEHQKQARRYLMNHDHFALFMEQGTGKTLPILYHISYLFKTKKIDNALIIAPLSGLGAWQRDLEKLPPQIRDPIKAIELINYDRIIPRTVKGKKQIAKVEETTWDIIVLDESHAIKHRTSQRSKSARRMGKNAKYRYILTGTPMSNGRLEQYWAQYDFLDPSIFGDYYKWENYYCRLDPFRKPYKYLHVEELTETINNHCYRITKEECLDLPEKLEPQIIEVELLEKKKYKEMLDNFIASLEIEASNPLVRSVKLRQIASGFIKDSETGETHELKTEKLKILDELLESREGMKTVIMAQFTHSIDQICALLKKRKIKYVVLDGRQKDKNIWRKYQADDSILVFVGQYDSSKEAIDLYSANHMILYEPTLSSSVYDQVLDRIHRVGQTTKSSYDVLLTKGTIETKIYETITKGSDFGKQILLDYLRKGEN